MGKWIMAEHILPCPVGGPPVSAQLPSISKSAPLLSLWVPPYWLGQRWHLFLIPRERTPNWKPSTLVSSDVLDTTIERTRDSARTHSGRNCQPGSILHAIRSQRPERLVSPFLPGLAWNMERGLSGLLEGQSRILSQGLGHTRRSPTGKPFGSASWMIALPILECSGETVNR